jgi:hypothetical protein
MPSVLGSTPDGAGGGLPITHWNESNSLSNLQRCGLSYYARVKGFGGRAKALDIGGRCGCADADSAGATGGLLRGILDLYARFLDWRTDRRTHRQARRQDEPPHFQEYFDRGPESIAAVLHTFLGAGASVLFGTTGQISGAYAAIVVGISAPVLLTGLSRIQSVSDALTGDQPLALAATEPTPQPEPAREALPAPSNATSSQACTEGTPDRPQFGPMTGLRGNGRTASSDTAATTGDRSATDRPEPEEPPPWAHERGGRR